MNSAPQAARGSVTRAMGRRLREASPVMTAVSGWLARMPSKSRAPVPALPMSITSSGSLSAPMPRPQTCQRPPASRSTSAPRARIAAAVASTSSPSSRPSMLVSPTARPPSIRARCEIDLSPGRRVVPDSASVGRAVIGPVMGPAVDPAIAPVAGRAMSDRKGFASLCEKQPVQSNEPRRRPGLPRFPGEASRSCRAPPNYLLTALHDHGNCQAGDS